MPTCLIAEPIHPVGRELLEAAGVSVRVASCPRLDEIPGELADVDAIIVRNALPAAAMDTAPRLRIIANHGTGTDAVDVAYAHRLGIPVAFTPTSNARSVAEHTIMLMLATARQAVAADAATRQRDSRFRYERRLVSLYGKTLGIIGFGHVGQLVCTMARGLGMQVWAWSPRVDPRTIHSAGATSVPTLDELLSGADVVSLHRPLREDTQHTLDRAALARLKPGSIVINTSRGQLIDEVALADALSEGRLFGAGLDVLSHEPLPPDSPLSELGNLVLSPHIAGSTQEALHDTARQCAKHIINALNDIQPDSLIDASVWNIRRRVNV
jgi:D-3-phosphoglycerate dehydrogenase